MMLLQPKTFIVLVRSLGLRQELLPKFMYVKLIIISVRKRVEPIVKQELQAVNQSYASWITNSFFLLSLGHDQEYQ